MIVVEPNSEFFKYLKSQGKGGGGANERKPAARLRTDAGAGGLLPFIAPNAWRETFRRLIAMSDGQIRFIGLTSMLVGLILIMVFK